MPNNRIERKKKCKHPTFKFEWFETKPKEKFGWVSCGWRAVCPTCYKYLTINDIRKQSNNCIEGIR